MSILVTGDDANDFCIKVLNFDTKKWTDEEKTLIEVCVSLRRTEPEMVRKYVDLTCKALGKSTELSLRDSTKTNDKSAPTIVATLDAFPFQFSRVFRHRDEAAIRDEMYMLAFRELRDFEARGRGSVK